MAKLTKYVVLNQQNILRTCVPKTTNAGSKSVSLTSRLLT